MPFLLETIGPGGLFAALWFGLLFGGAALLRAAGRKPADTERGLPSEIETSRMRWRDR